MKTLSDNRESSPTILQGKHSPITERQRRGIASLAVVVISLVVVVGAVTVIFVEFPPKAGTTVVVPIGGQTTSTGTGVTPSSCSGMSAGKIALNFGDLLVGGSTSPTTVKIIPDAGAVVGGVSYSGKTASESVTISSGTGTTTNQYPCGTGLSVYTVLSGSQNAYWHITAPGATQAQIQGGQWPAINLFTIASPTLLITVTDDKGNSYTSGTTVANFTNSGHCTTNNKCLGESSITFTVTITNTASNSGYMSSYDPTFNQNWCSAILMKENGSNPDIIGVSGFPANYGTITVGSTRYWQATLPDGISIGAQNVITSNSFAAMGFTTTCSQYSMGQGGLSTQKQAGSNVGGSVTLKITVTQGSLVHGNTLVLTPSIFEYYDPVYAFSNSASGGTNAVQFTSAYFHLKLAA